MHGSAAFNQGTFFIIAQYPSYPINDNLCFSIAFPFKKLGVDVYR